MFACFSFLFLFVSPLCAEFIEVDCLGLEVERYGFELGILYIYSLNESYRSSLF